ncbi:MAG: hypothetical protein R3C10_20915 [Pirellulales bacterium]
MFSELSHVELSLIALALLALELFGFLCAAHAVLRARTSQGAIAWGLFLITLPHIAVPFYLVLGRSRFQGYITARREGDHQLDKIVDAAGQKRSKLGCSRRPPTLNTPPWKPWR